MEGAVAEWITTGVDVLIVSVLLVGFLSVLNMGNTISEAVTQQNDLVNDLSEYREWNQYDNTTVYPEDVLSAIYRYRGEPIITVQSSRGNYTWSRTSAPCAWNTAAITALIDQTRMYQAEVVRGTNGDITGYQFRAI